MQRARSYPLLDAEYPLEVTYGRGAAWVALWTTNRLLRIDAVSGRTSYIRVGNGPRDPVLAFGSVWVAMGEDGTVWRIHPRSRKVEAVIDVGRLPWGLAVGEGAVWVTNNCDGTVSRIDPRSDAVVATIDTGFFPQWVAAAGAHLWVGLAETWSPVAGSGPSTLEGCD
jgi:DNA-binding beta-propeller fold protein YncE